MNRDIPKSFKPRNDLPPLNKNGDAKCAAMKATHMFMQEFFTDTEWATPYIDFRVTRGAGGVEIFINKAHFIQAFYFWCRNNNLTKLKSSTATKQFENFGVEFDRRVVKGNRSTCAILQYKRTARIYSQFYDGKKLTRWAVDAEPELFMN
jgi:hypothetical protein